MRMSPVHTPQAAWLFSRVACDALFPLLIRSAVDRLRDHLRVGPRGRIERRPTTSHVERHPREIHDAAVPAVATQVVRRAHEDAVYRTRLDAQRTEHALRIVDRVAGDLEALAAANLFLTDVNAIDGASLRALVAGDAGRQIEAMEAAIARRHRHRQLRILEVLGERLPLRLIRLEPSPQRDPHAVGDGVHRLDHIAEPRPDGFHLIDHSGAQNPYETAAEFTARNAIGRWLTHDYREQRVVRNRQSFASANDARIDVIV